MASGVSHSLFHLSFPSIFAFLFSFSSSEAQIQLNVIYFIKNSNTEPNLYKNMSLSPSSFFTLLIYPEYKHPDDVFLLIIMMVSL